MDALPALSAIVPSTAAPSLNVSVPAGVPDPGATTPTVAVNFTSCPDTEGFTDETTVVLVAALLTVWETAGEVLAAKFVPVKLAVIECAPGVSVDDVKVVFPPAS